MARGKRAESNGLEAANALKDAQERHQEEIQAGPAADETEGDEESPGVGHNGPEPDPLTDDQRLALTFMHKRLYAAALAAKKTADAALKNVAKLAKAELGPEAVADIKDIIAIETEEGEAKLKAEVDRQMRVARWMNIAEGTQTSMFETADRTPGVDRAAERGKRDGLAGEPCSPSCDPTVPQYKAYMDAYQIGQRVMFSIKPLTPESDAGDEVADEFDTIPAADEPPAPEASLS